MSLKVYNYMCTACDAPQSVTVEFEDRDLPQTCPVCGLAGCERTWQGMTVAVSTSKTSLSIPDAAAAGRFDGLRRKQALKKAKSDARQSGDRQTEKEVDKALGRKK